MESIIMEIRAGEGGDDACLFSQQLFEMYLKYCLKSTWKAEILYRSEKLGKESIVKVTGKGVFSKLKNENGGHRVQRVPQNERGGRVHTSTATVAVLNIPEEKEFQIDPKDLHFDTFRSHGKGGQNVNKTNSAVRVVHIPTGTTVECQDERSQLQNKIRALEVLRARLSNRKAQEASQRLQSQRRSLAGYGDRTDKIRTYNFVENRVVDHLTGVNKKVLKQVMNGDIEAI